MKHIKQIIFVVIYCKDLTMRERHFANKADADSFSLLVNGSVCECQI